MYSDDNPSPMEPKTFPAEFLNVDLDVTSIADPGVLVEAWHNRVIQMHAGKRGRRHWLRLTLARQPNSPTDAIRSFTRLVQRLPRPAATIWARAAKEFDIGIQAGCERQSAEWVLEPEIIRMVADLGAHLRLTVYSPLLLLGESGPAKRPATTRTDRGRRGD